MKRTKNFYKSDDYIDANPSLHEEDSPWKISLLLPLIDEAVMLLNKKEITLLDVGGGKGIILSEISAYIQKKFGITVYKYALDLSPGMLKLQKELNPDIKLALNESIAKTSLGEREIDIALLIDVLEHVPHPEDACKELQRISHFTILKVPLEDCLYFNVPNFVSGGRLRKRIIKKIGHINVYNHSSFRNFIERELGRVIIERLTNVFKYYTESSYYKRKMGIPNKVVNHLGRFLFAISPYLAAKIFIDFAIVLVENRTPKKD